LYYERTESGEEYVKHCRRKQKGPKDAEEGKEEVLLDCVALAEESDFLAIGTRIRRE
jgi:protease II